jgi:hypothetical protein
VQISTTPQPSRKIIDASLPKNISDEEKASLEKKWADAARIREEAIANETRIPDEPKRKLKFELRQFGKHWNAYYKEGVRFVPLLPAPSLLSSALELLADKMADQALKV